MLHIMLVTRHSTLGFPGARREALRRLAGDRAISPAAALLRRAAGAWVYLLEVAVNRPQNVAENPRSLLRRVQSLYRRCGACRLRRAIHRLRIASPLPGRLAGRRCPITRCPRAKTAA